VCSGIEAASVAWESLGWSAAWFAEIDAFPSAVLEHHWPHVPNLGDMAQIAEWISNGWVEAPDILVGGTPCQAFSVAGARQSLDDERGKLSLEYIKLANAIDSVRGEDNEAIIVWENVPGVLNTKDNAFGCFLGALAGEECPLDPSGGKWTNAGCVFGPQRAIAWRVLDAQYFGVAQRRRRVFVVASARKGFDPSQVLFEFDSVRRDIAPSRETGQDPTAGVGVGFAGSSFAQYRPVIGDGGTIKASGGDLGGGSENLVVSIADDVTQKTNDNVAFTLSKTDYKCPQAVYGCTPSSLDSSKVNTITKSYGAGGPDLETKPLLLVGANDNAPKLYDAYQHHGWREGETCGTLTVGQNNTIRGDTPLVSTGLVRRLTPIECERLQGFPDNHTQIPYRNKSADLCPDGPRYAACGNSMAVPVMHWIGKRIDSVVNTK
jgi:DNA (cytosine-5)-methyltransferase 1